MTYNLSHAKQGIYVSCRKTSLHWAGKMYNVNMYRFFLQKEELLSATTLRNLQQPSDFLQGFNNIPM